MHITKEIKIAIVAIIGLVILFFGLKFLKGMSLFDTDDTYYITFSEIGGLTKSMRIYADGYQVGVVKDITYDYQLKSPIKAAVSLNKDMNVPVGTRAVIEKDLMGNMQVDLLLGTDHNRFLPAGSTIPGSVAGSALTEAAELIPAIKAMLPKMDSILSGVNRIVNDPALQASEHNLQTISTELAATSLQVHSMSDRLNGQLPGMLSSARGTLDNANRLTGSLAAADIDGTMRKINATLDNVHRMTDKLNSSDNSLGLLMNDRGLYDNLNTSVGSLNKTLGSADTLLTDLKAHPKRYVHFSLFGKKDK